MIVPDYWAEARRQYRGGARQITVRRLGWSALSADDARALAERRADEALSRLVAGERLERREPKVPYNGATGVPIREEVLTRHGEVVITRNAYGARCLNTPDVLFADVDFEAVAAPKAVVTALALLVLLSVLIGFLQESWRVGLVLVAVSAFVSSPIVNLLRRLGVAAQGGPEVAARRRLANFLVEHQDWNVRVYRTPMGLRLLVTHRPFRPSEPEVSEFFRTLAVDPIYARMCLNQHCFRARLTAKPWRIGLPTHMRPRPGVWPVAPEQLARRSAWVLAYERRAAEFAACKFIESMGSAVVHQRVHRVIDLHDVESRANDVDTPIA
jgi:hypothetical protein